MAVARRQEQPGTDTPPVQPAAEPAVTPVTEPVAPAAPQPAVQAPGVDAYPMPDVAPAVQRLIEEPYLSDLERRALRIRHGQWTPEDVADPNDPDSAALAALIDGRLDDPSLTNDATSPLLRAQGELERGQHALAVDRLAPVCADPKALSLRAILLRAQGLEAMGRVAEADASLEPLVTRMAELSKAETWADADEIAEGVRGLLLRTKWRGPQLEGGADFKAMLAMLERARETVDKLNWNVAIAEAELLADKDNYADAAAALTSALVLNPRQSRAWAMLGRMSVNGFDVERAEQIVARLDEIAGGPSLEGAMVLARARLRQKDADAAAVLLEPWLARYPGHLELLALRAAVSAARFDFADVDARLKAVDALVPQSPAAYHQVGSALAEARQYEEAARYLGEAATRSPHWAAPVVELGLLEVQSGRNEQALAALQRAATLDPFNVRVANSLKLISDLRGFMTIESAHFIVRYRSGVDEVLASEMLPVLERIHARVTGSGPGGIRHEPAGKTVIELMPDHHWFSVRITGMPKLHTIAAATGPLVAMEAPRSGPGHLVGPYDWPRVVQHEYTHTVTLSRTKNRLPHWFTEAAAVYLEDAPRDWPTVQLLARTVADDELFTLDEINLAFVRPKRPTDRQLAYAQGHWMYQYIVETHGPEAPLALMDAYAQGSKEEQAYASILGVSREVFVQKFTHWAKERLVEWGMELPADVPSAEKLLERHNAQITSEGSQAIEEPTRAILDQWLVQFPAHPELLGQMVEALLKESKEQVSAELVPWLERYAAARPPDPMPHKLLARYFLDGKGGGKELAIPHLRFLDQREQHSPTFAMELARLLLSQGDVDGSATMTARAVAMSPYDAGVREFAATMALRRQDLTGAEKHIRALIALEPDREIHTQRLDALLRKLKDGSSAPK
jgi:cellulose synthase operon protein C